MPEQWYTAWDAPRATQEARAVPTDPATLAQQIADAAAAPKRAKTDAIEVENHDLDQQIEAVKFAAAAGVSANPFAALRFAQATPSSPMGTSYSPGDWP